MTVDYHIHTLHSDAVLSVEEVLDKAQRQNIQSLAITDHDTVAGISIAKAHCKPSMEYITGIEITCSEFLFPQRETPLSIHLLGYGFDEADEALNQLLTDREEASRRCYLQLLEDLKQHGICLQLEEIPISCGCVMQLCDVANYLTDKIPTIEESILSMVHSHAKKLTQANISFEEGIFRIHSAGGKTVWAHPFVGYHDFQRIPLTQEEILNVVDVLIEAGLDGLETDYLGFSCEQQAWLRQTAERKGLFRTAGSDFHGSPSRNRIGVMVDSQPEEMHRLLREK